MYYYKIRVRGEPDLERSGKVIVLSLLLWGVVHEIRQQFVGPLIPSRVRFLANIKVT